MPEQVLLGAVVDNRNPLSQHHPSHCALDSQLVFLALNMARADKKNCISSSISTLDIYIYIIYYIYNYIYIYIYIILYDL